ncbi:hypothetical protein A2778_01250 [Candidatus Daviesbacteria bacterium RIFCSPHIGHO2_01_FULL_40_24]|nr:MAG: hypothetical protein A2778_01250 [Candidatus Daviesbacteria bacterium RIFCSPHIGHO2_01_FULL_40_24]OGE29830.1 MAG: hypothetical protein A3C29_00875 [Candidatus Daviesbacteria bacterium RIFCSPHIGHO2_02_FULL_40_16]OGE42779.1 MAG: hypothetical protein A3A53_05695 [Candidatus Daviesbacteria bacterium RIFCSPLOWO2_01_FULL_39_23]OGE67307.1 MAG: hypothetical protein A3J16_06420 [Candidatus Daviesbacteria bacterium RIFCSPLOWO2_02_FULL_39_13]HCE31476.1 hypothetical protein [Candidatus Daviesbacteri
MYAIFQGKSMDDDEPKPQYNPQENLASKTRKTALEQSVPLTPDSVPEVNPDKTPSSPITSYEPFKN